MKILLTKLDRMINFIKILFIMGLISAVGCSGLKGKIQNSQVIDLQSSYGSNSAARLKAKIQKNCEAAKRYDVCLIDKGKEYLLKIGKLKDEEKGILEDGPLT